MPKKPTKKVAQKTTKKKAETISEHTIPIEQPAPYAPATAEIKDQLTKIQLSDIKSLQSGLVKLRRRISQERSAGITVNPAHYKHRKVMLHLLRKVRKPIINNN